MCNKKIIKKYMFPASLVLPGLLLVFTVGSCVATGQSTNKKIRKEKKIEAKFPGGYLAIGKYLPKKVPAPRIRNAGPDVATQVSGVFGPEITRNIKKLGFKNEKEYRQKIIAGLGVKDEDSVLIRQKTYNGVPGVSIMGGKGISSFFKHRRAKTPVSKSQTKKRAKQARSKLSSLFRKVSSSSKLSATGMNELITCMNQAGLSASKSRKYIKRFKKLVEKKSGLKKR